MTRLLSLLLLVCFVFTQTAAAECSLVPDPPHPAAEEAASPVPAAHAQHHHGSHRVSQHHAPTAPRDTPPAPRDRSPAHHASTGCAAAMACGVVALPASAAEAAHAPAATQPAHPRTGPAYLSPVLGTDPPPPRPAARN